MSGKHTPGPWQLCHEFQPFKTPQWVVTGEDSDFTTAYIHAPDAMSKGELSGEYLANARLIAAAPEMLQALQYAMELIPIARGHFPKSIKHGDKFQLENTCATIGKAIHKATQPNP